MYSYIDIYIYFTSVSIDLFLCPKVLYKPEISICPLRLANVPRNKKAYVDCCACHAKRRRCASATPARGPPVTQLLET